jgi:hypothetical protein
VVGNTKSTPTFSKITLLPPLITKNNNIMKIKDLRFLKSSKSARAVIVTKAGDTPLKHLDVQGEAIGWLRAIENEQQDLIDEIMTFTDVKFKIVQKGKKMNEISIKKIS